MNLDARISVALPSHPKTKKLIRRVGFEGAWGLVCLILWVSQNRPSGDLAGISDEDLELAIDWRGTPSHLVNALVEVGFLDGDELQRSIHDWAEHNPYAASAKSRRDQARFAGLVGKYGRERAEQMMDMFHVGQAGGSDQDDCESAGGSEFGNGPPSGSHNGTDCQSTGSQLPAAITPTPTVSKPYLPNPAEPAKKARGRARTTGTPFVLPDWIPPKAWKDYLEMRVKIRKPMTDRAKELAVETLARLKVAGYEPALVLDQSVFRSWQGLFEIKPDYYTARGLPPAVETPAQIALRRMEERDREEANAAQQAH